MDETIFSRLLGHPVTTVKAIDNGGGKNSRVYRLQCEGPRRYIAKKYFRHQQDQRDRLAVEFSGLQFLKQQGVTCVPQPIAANRSEGWGIYEFIKGRRIPSSEVTGKDIEDAVRFLIQLERLKDKDYNHQFPRASEACFSMSAIINNIQKRLDRLTACCHEETLLCHALEKFLTTGVLPFFEEVQAWCRSRLKKLAMKFAAELPWEQRTLSPSDFGFHNALRLADGRIVYLDFEYFGWDDPAKMVSDFLLHPAMELNASLKRQFATTIVHRLKNHKNLALRIEIVYPLFGLKWITILLNEFVPEYWLRRGFAGGKKLEQEKAQKKQLAKAKRLLAKVKCEYGNFPYWN